MLCWRTNKSDAHLPRPLLEEEQLPRKPVKPPAPNPLSQESEAVRHFEPVFQGRCPEGKAVAPGAADRLVQKTPGNQSAKNHRPPPVNSPFPHPCAPHVH